MKKIKIFDTTLRDGEQSVGCSMTMEEKVLVAKKLDKLNVDVIEAGFAVSSKKDYEAIKKIAAVCKNATITSLARCKKSDIDASYEALKDKSNRRVHLFIATSDIHMKYKLKMNKEEVINKVKESVSYANKYFSDIEFSCEDATRSEKEFLIEVINTAIKSGATTINIPDTVGYVMPNDFYKLIKYVKENIIKPVNISVHTHNDLGLAVANSIMAVKAGANQVECTINGIGERAGNASLEEIVAILKVRKDYFNCYTDIDTHKIYETSKMVEQFTDMKIANNKPIVGKNVFRHEAGIHQHGVLENKETYEIMNPSDFGIDVDNIVIGVHSGKHAIIKKIQNMNLEPDDYDINEILKQVKEYCSKINKEISDEEIKEIVLNNKQVKLSIKKDQ